MVTSSTSRVIASSMNVVFGFMAALILTEFLKVASLTYYARTNISSLAFLLIVAIFLFYMIFDTLVWLVFSDKNPVQQSVMSNREAVLDSITWLGCRMCEFFSVIWLYDFVNVISDLGKPDGEMKFMKLLARFNLDAALVSLGWALWFLIYHFTLAYRDKLVAEQKELRRQGALHFLAMILFTFAWALMSTDRIISRWVGLVLTYFLVIGNIFRIFFTQPTYYKGHSGLYGA